MTIVNFFTKVRASLYRGALAQTQVDGINAVLKNWAALGTDDNAQLAYVLATVYNETGGKFEPVEENLNYTSIARLRAVWPSRFKSDEAAKPYVRDPQALAEKVYGNRVDLGNDAAGDGWLYRGRGLGQCTGKHMHKVIGDALGIDLVAHPEALNDLDTSAAALIVGMLGGLYTGVKLSNFVDSSKGHKDYRGARTTVNGDIKLNGARIAEIARDFEAALDGVDVSAEFGAPEPAPAPVPVPAPQPEPNEVQVPVYTPKWSIVRIGIALLLLAGAFVVIAQLFK